MTGTAPLGAAADRSGGKSLGGDARHDTHHAPEQQATRHHAWLIRLAGRDPFRMFLPGAGGTLDDVLHLVEIRFPGAAVERVRPVR